MTRPLLPVLILLAAASCNEAGERTAPLPTQPLAAAPSFDLGEVVRRVHFAYRRVAGGFEGGHDTYGVRAESGGAVALTPRGGLPLAVETLAIEGAKVAPARPRLAKDGSLELVRGEVVEQLRNLEEGIEQRWTLERRPEGTEGFSVLVRLSGLSYVGATAGGLHFADSSSGLGVRYGVATWVDARGVRTPIAAEHAGDEVTLSVPRTVLDASSFPAVLDPVLSPEFGMDNPVSGPGAASSRPAVAFDGTNFLVVWEDRRRPEVHLYATRVSPAGAVLDPAGIAIGTTTVRQFDPAVAYANGQYLVAWEQSATFGTSKVYASRVSTSGVVLDPAGIFLSGRTSGNDERDPAISGDAVNFVVVWEEAISSGGTILGERVGPAGNRLDPAPIQVSRVSSGYSEIQKEPAIAFTGAGWLIAWYDDRSGNWDIYANRLTSAGAVLDGTGFAIANGALGEYLPSVAFDGTNALVVWEEFPASGRDTILYAKRVSQAGTLVDATPILVCDAVGEQSDPKVAFDGSQYLVVWSDQRVAPGDLTGTRVTTAGAVLDAAGLPLVTHAEWQGSPTLAFGGGRYLLAWSDSRSGASSVYAGRFGVSGAAQDGAGFPAASAPNGQLDPAAAFDGTNYLVVWSDTRSGAPGIFGTRVTPQGGVLDLSGIAVSGAGVYATKPQLAWNGSSYLVVWVPSGTTLLARRVGASGSVLDAADIAVAFPRTLGAVAAAGSTFLVVGTGSNTGTGYDVEAARVSGAGVVLDSAAIALSSAPGNQFEARVGSDGTGFFAVWHDYRGGTQSHIYGARVSVAGAVLDASGVLLSGSAGATDYQTDPAIAFDGTNYLVVWDDSRNSAIRGTRVTTGGAVLDAASILVASPPTVYDVLSEPRVAFDGANHVVAWENERFNSSYQTLSHTLYALRVSPAATVLDSRMAVATHPTEDLFASLASDGAGGTLIGYVYPNTSSGYAIDRVRARIFSATPPAGSCTAGSQCASGFCVDGVCCNVACGGGSTDCMACSIAAGAAADGTCGPVPAGRGCSDGNACTTVDACSAGVCLGSNPVQCAAIDACHVTGVCSTATGVCSTPTAPNGTLCPGGACTAGVCVQPPDAGPTDAGFDAGTLDAGGPDAGRPDAGFDAGALDAGAPDAGRPDAGVDAGTLDAGAPDAGRPDAGFDAGTLDAGAPDAGKPDAGSDSGVSDAGAADAGATDGGGTPHIIIPAVDGGGGGGVPPGCGCAAGGTSGAGWLMLVALAALSLSRGRPARGTAVAGTCGRDLRR